MPALFSVLLFFIVVGVSNPVIAQQRNQPPDPAAAANEQFLTLHKAARYQDALPYAQQVVALRERSITPRCIRP